VSLLIVIEGLDGSGKNTLAQTLGSRWRDAGHRVATMSFPRYGDSIHDDLVRDALYGRLGDVGDTVYGPALLFALDRRGATDRIRLLLRENDIVLLDRYIASNAAYGAARLGGPDVSTGFPEWVRELEVDRFGVPVPDRQLLLATDRTVAAGRARSRAARDSRRALDRFESDADLQRRTAGVYAELAGQGYLSPWTVVDTDGRPAGLANAAEAVGDVAKGIDGAEAVGDVAKGIDGAAGL
jgi:dTMP kinase